MAQEELRIDAGLDLPFPFPAHTVDAHIHIGYWSEFDLDFTIDDLELVMAQYGIEGAVVMPALRGDRVKANMDLLKQVRGDSRFHFFAWVDPTTTIAELEGYGDDLRGLKFHASISQTSITEGRMRSALYFADYRRLPFLYHAGRTPISWPDRLIAVALEYPNAKFILAHLGGNAYDRIYDTMRRWPTLPENVWVESSTARHPDLLARAFHRWGYDRLLYGSDLPFTDMRLNFDCLRYAGLDRHTDFMGGNLLRLLKQ
jgi:predicted TIM-barrel fold metal-dependent hydrolase